MTGFLLRLPFAAARDLWAWAITEPCTRFANLTHFPIDEKDADQ